MVLLKSARSSLGAGWDLVGLKGAETKSIGDLLVGQTQVISVWKWLNNTWAVYLPEAEDKGESYAVSKGFILLEHITPGEGFWVNSSGEATLPLRRQCLIGALPPSARCCLDRTKRDDHPPGPDQSGLFLVSSDNR